MNIDFGKSDERSIEADTRIKTDGYIGYLNYDSSNGEQTIDLFQLIYG